MGTGPEAEHWCRILEAPSPVTSGQLETSGDAVSKLGRNDLCLCGSGKKYKNCCLLVQQEQVEEVVGINTGLLAKVVGSSALIGVLSGLALGDAGDGVTVFFAAVLLLGGFFVLRKPPPSNPNSGDPSSLNFGR